MSATCCIAGRTVSARCAFAEIVSPLVHVPLRLQGKLDAATMNSTVTAFSPPSIEAWLDGSFSGVYVPADLSDPFQARVSVKRALADNLYIRQ